MLSQKLTNPTKMVLKVLGSSSLGNCYLLDSRREALIVEAGVPLSVIRKSLQNGLNRAAGAIITHRHGDHAKSVKDLLLAGIPVLAPRDVFESIGADRDLCAKFIEHSANGATKGYCIGGFRVIPFEVEHDAPCVGYIIIHPEMGQLLFVTDTMTIKQAMPKHLTQIMIETNYADDILERNIESGLMPVAMRKRLMFSHMELGTAKTLLSRMDLSEVRNIILIHLSSSNSDEERFVSEVAVQTGKMVYAADEGREFDISLEPY